ASGMFGLALQPWKTFSSGDFMRRNFVRSCCLVIATIVGLVGCATTMHEQAPPPLSLIPAPVSVTTAVGSFEVRDGTPIILRGGADADAIAGWFADTVQRSRALRLERSVFPADAADVIEFALDPGFHVEADGHGEAYSLDVGAHRITVT